MTSIVSKLLSTGFLVSREAFAKLTASKQTEILVDAAGRPIVFVDNFNELQDGKKIAEKFLAGDDISTEIEFNGLTVSDEQRNALSVIKPFLVQLKKLAPPKPLYNWVEPTANEIDKISRSRFSETRIQNSAGYSATVTTIKMVWQAATKYWTGGKKPAAIRRSLDGYSRDIEILADRAVFGCQQVSRAELEAAAKHYGWKPVVYEGK